MTALAPLEGMTSLPRTAGRPTGRPERRLGVGITTVLLLDACCHLYWATGATWPAADESSLSIAVLGFGVDFRPSLLLGLALLLSTGAGLVLARAYLGRRHRLGPLWQAGTVAVTAGTLARGLAGVVWAVPAFGDVPASFYWINLLAYTPLCLAMAVAGLRLLRADHRPAGARRGSATRMTGLLRGQ